MLNGSDVLLTLLQADSAGFSWIAPRAFYSEEDTHPHC